MVHEGGKFTGHALNRKIVLLLDTPLPNNPGEKSLHGDKPMIQTLDRESFDKTLQGCDMVEKLCTCLPFAFVLLINISTNNNIYILSFYLITIELTN